MLDLIETELIMNKILSKPLSYLSAFAACSIMSFATGCASGGYHLTRQYAQWVNSNPVILRVILYILTGFVFAITLLIDVVYFNTMDFWDGRVSAGSYEFKDQKKTFQVRHEYQPGHLRRSTIHVNDENKKLLQEVVFNETSSGEVEFFVDGKLRSRVHNISEIPIASNYDENGNLVSEKMLFSSVATVAHNGATASF
jgi:hypothetical protein